MKSTWTLRIHKDKVHRNTKNTQTIQGFSYSTVKLHQICLHGLPDYVPNSPTYFKETSMYM